MNRGAASFERATRTTARGRVAERVARHWLKKQGYRIVASNVHTGPGEIDLVAHEDDVLCFIEVKARSAGSLVTGVEAVGWSKQQRITRAAEIYLMQNPHDGPCRFDVLGMESKEGKWVYTLIRDAFSIA